MNLRKKKLLAAKALNVGVNRIAFLKPRLEEIKEIITKQDVRDLFKDGAIKIKQVEGRRKVEKKARTRGPGKTRKKLIGRKQKYVKLTRKLRKYIRELKKRGKISGEDIKNIRKEIRNKKYRSESHLKEQLNITKDKK